MEGISSAVRRRHLQVLQSRFASGNAHAQAVRQRQLNKLAVKYDLPNKPAPTQSAAIADAQGNTRALTAPQPRPNTRKRGDDSEAAGWELTGRSVACTSSPWTTRRRTGGLRSTLTHRRSVETACTRAAAAPAIAAVTTPSISLPHPRQLHLGSAPRAVVEGLTAAQQPQQATTATIATIAAKATTATIAATAATPQTATVRRGCDSVRHTTPQLQRAKHENSHQKPHYLQTLQHRKRVSHKVLTPNIQ